MRSLFLIATLAFTSTALAAEPNLVLLRAKENQAVAALNKEGVGRFVRDLKTKRITEFYANPARFGNKHLKAVAEGLHSLEILNLEGSLIGDEGIKYVTKENLPDLKKLNLACTLISPQEEAALNQRYFFRPLEITWELSQDGYKAAFAVMKAGVGQRFAVGKSDEFSFEAQAANGKVTQLLICSCSPEHVRLASGMTSVEDLTVSYSDVDKNSLLLLRHFKNLKVLNLRATEHIDNEVVEVLVTANPKLVRLDLTICNEFDGDALAHIAKLKDLRLLDLSARLDTLDRSYAKHIEKMEKLHTFLGSKCVEAELIPALLKAGKVRQVDIEGLSPAGAAALKRGGVDGQGYPRGQDGY